MTHCSSRRAVHHPSRVTPLLCLLILLFSAGITCAATVGDQVELRATQRSSVPFHRAPGGSPKYQRLPTGTVGTVMELAREGRWLRISLPDTRTGWIAARYVGRTVAGPSPGATDAERRVWTSPEACQQVVASGDRMAPANPAILRVGSWNVRWFPRGCPSNRTCPDKATDIPWLACTIAWMHADLFALQEILATPDAELSLNSLRAELNRLTGGSWQVDLQACGGASDQHVGFLWQGSRVAMLQRTDVWELNGAATGPTANACSGNLRPGRYALAKTPIGARPPSASARSPLGTRRSCNSTETWSRWGTITPWGGRTRPRSRPRKSSRSLTMSSRRGSGDCPWPPAARSTLTARAAPSIMSWSAPACRRRAPPPA
jgi:hypothetical protein